MATETIEVNGKTIWVTAEPVHTHPLYSKIIQTVPNQYLGYYRYAQPAEAVPGEPVKDADGTPKVFATPEAVTEYVRSMHQGMQ